MDANLLIILLVTIVAIAVVNQTNSFLPAQFGQLLYAMSVALVLILTLRLVGLI